MKLANWFDVVKKRLTSGPIPSSARERAGYGTPKHFVRLAQLELMNGRDFLNKDKQSKASTASRNLFSKVSHYAYSMMLSYLAGELMTNIRERVPELLDACEYAQPIEQSIYTAMEHSCILDVGRDYGRALWTFCLLLGLRCTDDTMRRLLTFTGVAGQDEFFDRLAAHFEPGRTIGRGPRHSRFRPLIPLTDALKNPDATAAAVQIHAYVDSWYQNVARVFGQYEAHGTDAYLGYLSFEAAAVVMLRGLDDSAFANHKYYPGELVHYYRTGVDTLYENVAS